MPLEIKVHNLIYHFEFQDKIINEDVDKFKNNFDDILNKHKSVGIIFDIRNAKDIDTSLMLNQINYMMNKEKIIKSKLIASSIILENKTIDTLLKVAFSIKKPVSPNLICNNLNDGMDFIKDYMFLNKVKC